MIDDNLLLEMLKGIGAAVDRNTERLDDMNHRITSVEQQVAGLRSDFVNSSAQHYSLEHRIERIEKRLELRDDA